MGHWSGGEGGRRRAVGSCLRAEQPRTSPEPDPRLHVALGVPVRPLLTGVQRASSPPFTPQGLTALRAVHPGTRPPPRRVTRAGAAASADVRATAAWPPSYPSSDPPPPRGYRRPPARPIHSCAYRPPGASVRQMFSADRPWAATARRSMGGSAPLPGVRQGQPTHQSINQSIHSTSLPLPPPRGRTGERARRRGVGLD
eukprot:scaffold346_cov387-Prasinococcus_capsulatus_cf.AAC.2